MRAPFSKKSSLRLRIKLTQKPNGSKFIATGTPVFDGLGEVIRVVVGERDVTEFVGEIKAEKQLSDKVAIVSAVAGRAHIIGLH